ncbi:MAG: hypothetical protein H7067_18880 [Burkholderiales bacterium]|nr:hypothetical protein [Opitutaceae bacterium]
MNVSSLLRSSSALLAMGVLSSVSQAQVLTVDTIISTTGGGVWTPGQAYTQTFTGADSLGSVTFRFVAFTAALGSLNAGSVDFSLTSWSGLNAEDGLSIATGSFALANGALWLDGGNGTFSYFDSTLDLSSVVSLVGVDTYGITLYGSAYTQASGFILGRLPIDTVYADGTGFSHGATVSGDLVSGGNALGYDFSFAATAASPVPEASSAAVLFAGVFVGGLMVRRRRRQPANAMSALQVSQA